MFVKRLFAQLTQSSSHALSTRWTKSASSRYGRPYNDRFGKANENTEKQVETLCQRLDPDSIKPTDWRDIQESYNSAHTVRSFLGVLGRKKLYNAGKSYIDMLQMYEPQFVTPFTEVYILRFFTSCFEACSDVDKQYLLNTSQKIMEAFPMLDSFSSEAVILALQRTPKWRDAMDLLESSEKIYKMSSHVYSAIIINALKEGDTSLAWSLINRMTESCSVPSDGCWIEWLQLCRRTRTSATKWEDDVGHMLNYFHTYHVHMSVTVADEMASFIKDFYPEYLVSKTEYLERGKCPHCLTRLHTKFNETDHSVLKELVEMIFYKNKSLFSSTTPRELERFKNCIAKFNSYDYVVDGLNMLYCQTVNFRQAVKDLKRNHHARILFLGRAHLKRRDVYQWIQREMAYTFLCENHSVDDAFVLYAAIYHRPNVRFFSNDKYRSQLAVLPNDKRRNLFLRWQYLNQRQFADRTVRTFLPEINMSENGCYHIPCVAQSSKELFWQPADPQHWLCLKRNKTIQSMTVEASTQQAEVSPDVADQLSPRDSVNVADQLSPRDSVNVADQLSPRDSVNVADQLSPRDSVNVADQLSPRDSVNVADQLSPQDSANVANQLFQLRKQFQRLNQKQVKRKYVIRSDNPEQDPEERKK